jgi:pheromone shutdown protein TraB
MQTPCYSVKLLTIYQTTRYPKAEEHKFIAVNIPNIKNTREMWYRVVRAAHIRGVSKKFGEWYQKTNKTEDTNKLSILVFKIIAILHNTLLATFIKLLETVM